MKLRVRSKRKKKKKKERRKKAMSTRRECGRLATIAIYDIRIRTKDIQQKKGIKGLIEENERKRKGVGKELSSKTMPKYKTEVKCANQCKVENRFKRTERKGIIR
jgi:hypothetical protein